MNIILRSRQCAARCGICVSDATQVLDRTLSLSTIHHARPRPGTAVPIRGNAASRWTAAAHFPSLAGVRGRDANVRIRAHCGAPHIETGIFARCRRALRARVSRIIHGQTLALQRATRRSMAVARRDFSRSLSAPRPGKRSIAAFEASDRLILVIAPEGTGTYVPSWKTVSIT